MYCIFRVLIVILSFLINHVLILSLKLNSLLSSKAVLSFKTRDAAVLVLVMSN